MRANKKNTETNFKELVTKQLKIIPTNKKLQLSDIKRISRHINSSIFDENNCSIWTGYITNNKNELKGMYVNFYFRKKKCALHRLLYSNFIGELMDDEYIKYNCEYKGKCCNIYHMNKFKYFIHENKSTNNCSDNIQYNILKKIDDLSDTGSDEFVLHFD